MSRPQRPARRQSLPRSASFSSLGAQRRAEALIDPDSLCALAEAGDPKTVWIGTGTIDGRRVLLALTDGQQRGGTVGVEEARVFTRLTAAALEHRPAAVVVCWDTGGVRVQEGPAALAAASAVGIGLTRLSLLGTPVATVISGPRGCFGAPSVIAATSQTVIVTAGSHWGLTGPKLLETASGAVKEATGRATTSARHRYRAGHADTLVADRPAAVRDALCRFLAAPPRRVSPLALVDECAARARQISARLAAERPTAPPRGDGERERRRDFFQYSFRGHWRPTGPFLRRAHVRAAWGELDGRPAMGIILGPERPQRGIGVEDAQAVTEMVRYRRARVENGAGPDRDLPLLPRPLQRPVRGARRPALRPRRVPAQPAGGASARPSAAVHARRRRLRRRLSVARRTEPPRPRHPRHQRRAHGAARPGGVRAPARRPPRSRHPARPRPLHPRDPHRRERRPPAARAARGAGGGAGAGAPGGEALRAPGGAREPASRAK